MISLNKSTFHHGLLLALLLVAALVRLYKIDYSLSLDEIGVVLMAKGGLWDAILNSAAHVGATPLSYIITNFVFHNLGDSEALLRLPSILFSVLTVAFVYLLGTRLFSRTVGLVAAGIMTMLPIAVYHARELRFYELGTFASVLVVYVFVWALQHGYSANLRFAAYWRKALPWLLFALTLTIALYAHYYALFLLPILALWVLAARRQSFGWFIGSSVLALILFAPWVYYDNVTVSDSQFGLSKAALLSIHISDLWAYWPKVAKAPFLDRPVDDLSLWWVYLLWGIWGLAPIAAVLYKPYRTALLGIWAITAMGTILIVFVNHVTGYGLGNRHLLSLLPFWSLAIAAVLFAILQRIAGYRLAYGGGLVLVVSAFVVFSSSLPAIYEPGWDYRAVGRYLIRVVGPGERVIVDDARLAWYYAPELYSPYVPWGTWSADTMGSAWLVIAQPSGARDFQPWESTTSEFVPVDSLQSSGVTAYYYGPIGAETELAPWRADPEARINELVNAGRLDEAVTLAKAVFASSMPYLFKQQVAFNLGGKLNALGQGGYAQNLLLSAIDALDLREQTGNAWTASIFMHLSLTYTDVAQKIDACRDAVRSDPTFYMAHEWLGNLLVNTDDRQEGIEQLQEAIKLAPDEATKTRLCETLHNFEPSASCDVASLP